MALDGLRAGKIHFSFVWTDMLARDDEDAALSAFESFPPLPNAAHFHDPKRLVGKKVAESVGAPGRVAWDFYLVYEKGKLWEGAPPPPSAWFHQLGDEAWTDPAHYKWGKDLGPAIASILDPIL
ncbi:MAG: hypothetical protein AB1750_16980 [Chloroflexota bacterium]